MLPIVIRSTEEMLRLVPDELRQGSYALGNRKWRTIVTVVLPAAFGGIISGVMLAVARAAGETAPLLFTIGAARPLNLDLFDGPKTALSTQIFKQRQRAVPGRSGPCLGRRPHADRHRLHLHHLRPCRVGTGRSQARRLSSSRLVDRLNPPPTTRFPPWLPKSTTPRPPR